jgi:phage N-6-adenine-methyltransferase
MTLIGYRSSNHPQQTRKRGANPEVDDRATHPEFFDPLHTKYGFTLDVAASAHNAKVERFFSIEDDGLSRSWLGERVWCNPPYSDIGAWVAKAWYEWRGGYDVSGGLDPYASCELIVMLLPANRTEQGWWQEMVEPHRDQPDSPLRVEFLRGRLRFIKRGQTDVGPNERPPFGCCLLVWSAPGVPAPTWRRG